MHRVKKDVCSLHVMNPCSNSLRRYNCSPNLICPHFPVIVYFTRIFFNIIGYTVHNVQWKILHFLYTFPASNSMRLLYKCEIQLTLNPDLVNYFLFIEMPVPSLEYGCCPHRFICLSSLKRDLMFVFSFQLSIFFHSNLHIGWILLLKVPIVFNLNLRNYTRYIEHI